MAALDAASLAFARTLAFEDIPTKLRCATCNKLAVGAVKLPCCDQVICEECLLIPRDQCPVCEHSPFSADECKPHKSLRMTVKAFVKNEEKKREKESVAVGRNGIVSAVLIQEAQATSNDDVDAEIPADGQGLEPLLNSEHAVPATAEVTPGLTNPTEATLPNDEQQVDTSAQDATEPSGTQEKDEEDEDEDEDNVVITTERPEREGELAQNESTAYDASYSGEQQTHNVDQSSGRHQQGQDFDNNFAQMSGFNPMLAMQNGMGMPGFPMGMTGMMGMPGMPMDPSMMFGGAFGGMNGMPDMNMMAMGMGMGMGMNGFGGMPGMNMNMNMNGPGFFPGQDGYNNSSFGPNMHQNFRNDRGFGGRPYGRGSGGRGRGYSDFRGRNNYGHQNQTHGYNDDYNGQGRHGGQNGVGEENENLQPQDPRPSRATPSYEPMNANGEIVSDDFKSKDIADHVHDVELPVDDAVDGAAERDQSASRGAATDTTRTANVNGSEPFAYGNDDRGVERDDRDGQHEHQTNIDQAHSAECDGEASHRNGFDETHGYHQRYPRGHGYAGRARGRTWSGQGFRGGRGGSAFNSFGHHTEATELTPVPAPPVNAPTGPKAMREGKPNSGWYSRPQPATMTSQVSVSQPEERQTNRTERERTSNRSRTQSRSRSRSRHSTHKSRHKSLEDDGYESDATYRRRKERERRKRRDRERSVDDAPSRHRSEDESREERTSAHRRRDKDDQTRSDRSRRDRSRERRRRDHRSRSPVKDSNVDGEEEMGSKRKAHRYDDDEKENARDRQRKSSRRVEDEEEQHHEKKDRSGRSHRSGRDRYPPEESSVTAEQPPDDFKIKGSRSAKLAVASPPPQTHPSSSSSSRRDRNRERDRERDHARDSSRRHKHSESTSAANGAGGTKSTDATTSAAADPYAEERERRHAERVLKEQQRRQSSNPSSLGKRSSRDEAAHDDLDGMNVPRGPRHDGRKGRKERRMNVRYEGEVGEDANDRDAARWR